MFGVGSSPHQYEGDYDLGNDYTSEFHYARYCEQKAWDESLVQEACLITTGYVDSFPFGCEHKSNFESNA